MAAKCFNYSVFLLHEQIYPFDAFGSTMLSHLSKLSAAIYEYPSLNDQRNQSFSFGYETVSIVYMNQFWLAEEERNRVLAFKCLMSMKNGFVMKSLLCIRWYERFRLPLFTLKFKVSS